jgi:hypothetical protein
MSKQKYKQIEHDHFVVTGPFLNVIFNGGSVVLEAGYFDHAGIFGEEGKYVEYITHKDKTGKDVPKRFRFDESLRRLLTRKTDKDYYGKSQYDFLKNHPQCEESPNARYEDGVQQGVVFRLLDTAKDAGVALGAETLTLKAKLSAMELDDQTLSEIANILGHYGDPDDLMRLKVVEFAGKRPSEYNELLNSGERSIRALIRKALKVGEFKSRGTLIMWEEFMVGADEDAAVATLALDSKMLKSLRDKLDMEAPPVKVKPVPPGKPKKSNKEKVATTPVASGSL